MRHGQKTSMQIIMWLPAIFLWLCVIAFLKEQFGFFGRVVGIMLFLFSAYMVGQLKRDDEDGKKKRK